jgi:hypothetical protein
LLNTEYQWDIYYLTYSPTGMLVDKFILAGHGGDGPNENITKGIFVENNTYQKLA